MAHALTRHRGHLRKLLVLGSLVATALPAHAGPDEARALVKRAVEALPRVPFVTSARLYVDRGEPRELRLSHKVIAGARASYLEIAAPIDLAGTRFLFLEHDQAPPEQYMKIASSAKIIQVGPELRKYSFLGSTFFVADLVEPPLDASTYAFVGQDEIRGRRCMLVETAPKSPAGALYAKVLVAIDPLSLLIVKRLFLDEKGTLLKVWTAEKIEKIDGYWTLLDQRMKSIAERAESRLEITEIKYNVELPDSMFTPRHLAR